ncbi:hypothetical protein BSNK01_09420 [Bacillaceae bacterium]
MSRNRADLDFLLRSISVDPTLSSERDQRPSNINLNIVVNHHVHNYYGTDRYITQKGGQGKMKTFVVLSKGEDGYVIAECPVLPGCTTQGRTREEAIENIKEAIQLHLEIRREMGLPDFEDFVEVEV